MKEKRNSPEKKQPSDGWCASTPVAGEQFSKVKQVELSRLRQGGQGVYPKTGTFVGPAVTIGGTYKILTLHSHQRQCAT